MSRRAASLSFAAVLLSSSLPLLTGCSDAKELRTAGQASRFLTSVADGADPGDWQLAGDAVPAARQVWHDRMTIGDLGQRLHHESYVWTCAFARHAGEARTQGPFSVGDRQGVVNSAHLEGAEPSQIGPMLRDVGALPEDELIKVTEAVCD